MLLAVTAIGPDRPGVLAAISGVVTAHGADVADARASLLSGHVGLLLVVEAPDDLDIGVVRRDLAQVAADLGIEVMAIDPLTASAPRSDGPDATLVVTVTGIDHPGIVHSITHQLARSGVNVCDLQARRIKDPGDPAALYAMMLEVAPPSGMGPERIEELLRPVAGERELDITVAPLDD
jgi:glycine cleavage system transcriptional repressor